MINNFFVVDTFLSFYSFMQKKKLSLAFRMAQLLNRHKKSLSDDFSGQKVVTFNRNTNWYMLHLMWYQMAMLWPIQGQIHGFQLLQSSYDIVGLLLCHRRYERISHLKSECQAAAIKNLMKKISKFLKSKFENVKN